MKKKAIPIMRSDSASETTPIISPISSFSTSPSSSLGTNSTSSAPLITQPALNSSHRMPIRQEDEQEELTEFRIFVDGGDGEEEDEDGSKVIEFREPLQALRPTIGSNQQEHNGFDFADSFLYMEMRKLKRATSGSYQQGRYTNPPPLFAHFLIFTFTPPHFTPLTSHYPSPPLLCSLLHLAPHSHAPHSLSPLSPSLGLWVVIYGLVAFLYTLGSLLLTTFPVLPTSLHEAIFLVDWKELVLAYVLGGTLCSASARVQTLATAFCIFWLYCFVLVYFLLPSAEINFSFGWAFGAAALLYLITWTLHFIYHYITPWLIARMHFWFNWRQLNHRTLLVAPPSSQFLSLQLNSSSERDEETEETTREEGEEDEVTLTISSSKSSSSSSSPLILQPLARGESDSSIPFSSSSTTPILSEVSYEYRSIANPWFCCTPSPKPSCFVYRGQVRNGRPHGRGEWRDDSFYGESLLGWWEDGLPVGPFESMERGTSNCFVSLRIAYCSIRTSWAFLPESERSNQLKFGVAGVECSISGSFYKNFPTVQHIDSVVCPHMFGIECGCFTKLLPELKHLSEDKPINSILITATEEGLSISAHEPINEERRDKAEVLNTLTHSLPGLTVSGWKSSHHFKEALVFIHGYNIPLDWAMKKLAQLLASGRFPSHIKPVVFSWPTGRVLSYLCAIKAAVAEPTVKDFAAMLRSLKEAGIRKVHVITHSMGIHLFLAAIRSVSVQSIFAPPSSSSLSNVDDNNDLSGTKRTQIGLRLTTVSFLNPDYPVKVFRDEDYPILRGLCQHISIYVDKDDSALYWSEKVGSRLKSLGLLSRPLRQTGLKRARTRRKTGGGVRTIEEAVQYLDVDLVDSSALQENFHSMRHSAFNVNRVLVEDLRDVIVEGLRARVRTSRLLNEKGNLYHFMTIPPTVNGNVV